MQAPSPATDNVDQFLGRVDQNLGNKIRFNVRYNWHDSFGSNVFNAAIPATAVTQPRVNNNWLVGYTHTLKPNLHNDFRIGYHRIELRHAQPVRRRRSGGRRLLAGYSGLRRRRASTAIPACRASTSATSPVSARAEPTGTSSTPRSRRRTCSRIRQGAHNLRAGFDLRRLATGRRAANDPRGLFSFTGDITGYSVADFMLGLPRTVIPPTDQIQGHVGGWRNGFFINDVWQPGRNLTLSLGLRYELNTPVQTYEGLATMLAEDLETIIPQTLPSPGFKFHDPNYKDIAPRLGATYRLSEKTVVRAGFGIYYNPNQMNSFTFLTNNPPLAAVTTYTSDPANPTLSFDNPTGPVGPAGAAGHDLADPRSAQRPQGSVELRPAA